MGKRFLLTRRHIRGALDALADEHPAIAVAVAEVGYPSERRRPAGFPTLARIVIGQQVSVAAATSIATRVESVLGGEIEAKAMLGTSDDVLRSAGLSRQKVSYLRSLQAAVTSGSLDLGSLTVMSDDQAIAQITAVRGFGVWSAHMYLMFSLGRTDVWPAGDLAVRNGFARIMGWQARPGEKEVALAGEGYAPYRSSLALLCWHYYSESEQPL